MAPVRGSSSETTCIAVAARVVPRTHSTYPVAVTVRARPDRFRIRTCQNFTGASTATWTVMVVESPSCACSKTEYPKPWRVRYGPGPRAGRGESDQNAPVSSSRR